MALLAYIAGGRSFVIHRLHESLIVASKLFGSALLAASLTVLESSACRAIKSDFRIYQ
jgi:hypothetical protein